MNYYEYIRDIKYKKGIWTYYEDIETSLYEKEYNYFKGVLKDRKDKEQKSFDDQKFNLKEQEKKIVKELKDKGLIEENFNYENLTKKEDIINFWTFIFDQQQNKIEKGQELNEYDCFWFILSSKQFLDVFGSSEGLFQVYRTNIIKIIEKYGVNLGGTSEVNKKKLEGEQVFNKLLVNAKYREEIIRESNKTILEIYFETAPNLKGKSKKIEYNGELKAELSPDFFRKWFIEQAQKAQNEGYFIYNEKGVKKTQIQLVMKVEKEDKNGDLVQNIQRTTVAVASEGTKREQIFSITEKNSDIFKEIKEATEKTGYKFKTAQKIPVKDYLAWAYRALKDGRYEKSDTLEANSFKEMALDLGKVEKKYFLTFCKAISETFKKMEDENIINLSLGIKKYTITKEQIKMAYNYINSKKGKYELYKLLKVSDSLHFLGYLYNYNIQSGTIGELLAIKNFKIFNSKSTGQIHDTNEEGKSLGQSFEDIKTDFGGVNIKHYMSQDFPTNLYEGSWSLESDYLKKYISNELQKILIYFNVNAPYFEEEIGSIKDILLILNENFPYFYRLLRINDNKQNVFYQINNLIIPSSLILEEFIKKKTMVSFFTFENINQHKANLKDDGNLLSCLDKTKQLGTKIKFTGMALNMG